MTETTPGWDPAGATRQTRCQRCGKTFGCRNLGEEGSCWCSLEPFRLPVPLSDGVRSFTDCLCPECLRAVADELGGWVAVAAWRYGARGRVGRPGRRRGWASRGRSLS